MSDSRSSRRTSDRPGGGVRPPGESTGVLVVNAGSSSLKLRLLDPSGGLLWADDRAADDRLDGVFAQVAEFGGVRAVGHRFVHGGPDLLRPTLVDAGVEARLRARTSLAPLHMPAALAGVAAVRAAAPELELAQVACFDTAFHASLPAAASTYAIPARWRERYGIRRYGFHGLSHAYASRRAAELLGPPDPR